MCNKVNKNENINVMPVGPKAYQDILPYPSFTNTMLLHLSQTYAITREYQVNIDRLLTNDPLLFYPNAPEEGFLDYLNKHNEGLGIAPHDSFAELFRMVVLSLDDANTAKRFYRDQAKEFNKKTDPNKFTFVQSASMQTNMFAGLYYLGATGINGTRAAGDFLTHNFPYYAENPDYVLLSLESEINNTFKYLVENNPDNDALKNYQETMKEVFGFGGKNQMYGTTVELNYRIRSFMISFMGFLNTNKEILKSTPLADKVIQRGMFLVATYYLTANIVSLGKALYHMPDDESRIAYLKSFLDSLAVDIPHENYTNGDKDFWYHNDKFLAGIGFGYPEHGHDKLRRLAWSFWGYSKLYVTETVIKSIRQMPLRESLANGTFFTRFIHIFSRAFLYANAAAFGYAGYKVFDQKYGDGKFRNTPGYQVAEFGVPQFMANSMQYGLTEPGLRSILRSAIKNTKQNSQSFLQKAFPEVHFSIFENILKSKGKNLEKPRFHLNNVVRLFEKAQKNNGISGKDFSRLQASINRLGKQVAPFRLSYFQHSNILSVPKFKAPQLFANASNYFQNNIHNLSSNSFDALNYRYALPKRPAFVSYWKLNANIIGNHIMQDVVRQGKFLARMGTKTAKFTGNFSRYGAVVFGGSAGYWVVVNTQLLGPVAMTKAGLALGGKGVLIAGGSYVVYKVTSWGLDKLGYEEAIGRLLDLPVLNKIPVAYVSICETADWALNYAPKLKYRKTLKYKDHILGEITLGHSYEVKPDSVNSDYFPHYVKKYNQYTAPTYKEVNSHLRGLDGKFIVSQPFFENPLLPVYRFGNEKIGYIKYDKIQTDVEKLTHLRKDLDGLPLDIRDALIKKRQLWYAEQQKIHIEDLALYKTDFTEKDLLPLEIDQYGVDNFKFDAVDKKWEYSYSETCYDHGFNQKITLDNMQAKYPPFPLETGSKLASPFQNKFKKENMDSIKSIIPNFREIK